MVSGASNSVMELPEMSKRLISKTVLASACWPDETAIPLKTKEVVKVALAWLLKSGGINRAPTGSSSGETKRYNNSFELKLMELIMTIEGLERDPVMIGKMTDCELPGRAL